MGMLDWAKREVEIAAAREREAEGVTEDQFSYGAACYESALKAFESLCEDGHSGMSIGFTKQILNRLIDGKCLTPIEDTEDNWDDISHYGGIDDGYRKYQCKRMSSLFKDVYIDGSIHYHDVERYYCKDINTGSVFKFGLVARVLDEMFPITMPYIPESEPYIFTVEDFKLNNTTGDFDTFVIYTVKKPDGKFIGIDRYYTENKNGKMVEISREQFVDIKVKYELEKLNESIQDDGESEE